MGGKQSLRRPSEAACPDLASEQAGVSQNSQDLRRCWNEPPAARWDRRFRPSLSLHTCSCRAREAKRKRNAGVTLLEMLIVVTIVATIVSVSFPALTAGLAGIRLTSAAGTVASFLTSAMNGVERREQPSAIVIDAKENRLAIFTAESGEKPSETLRMPQGIAVEGDKEAPARRFLLYPGGAFPRIELALKNEKGARKTIAIDPITAVPQIR